MLSQAHIPFLAGLDFLSATKAIVDMAESKVIFHAPNLVATLIFEDIDHSIHNREYNVQQSSFNIALSACGDKDINVTSNNTFTGRIMELRQVTGIIEQLGVKINREGSSGQAYYACRGKQGLFLHL